MQVKSHTKIAREHLDMTLLATSPFWHVLENQEHEHIHTDKKLYSCWDCCKRFIKGLRYQNGGRRWDRIWASEEAIAPEARILVNIVKKLLDVRKLIQQVKRPKLQGNRTFKDHEIQHWWNTSFLQGLQQKFLFPFPSDMNDWSRQRICVGRGWR